MVPHVAAGKKNQRLKNFRSPLQKDFFNTIRGKADVPIAFVEVTIDPQWT